MNKILGSLLLCFMQANILLGQDLEGTWTGSIPLNGNPLELSFTFSKTDTGWLSTLDIPKQGLNGYKIQGTRIVNPLVDLQVPEFNMAYKGSIHSDSLIEGHLFQHGIKLALNLTRANIALHRPQNPVGDLPYMTEEITFQTKEGFKLKGTLSLPSSKSYPLVMLVSGSGPQDRDGTLFGHKPNLVIADYLTRNGIAVLRYDEKGVGASEGTYAGSSIETQYEDVLSALAYIQNRKDLNINALGLIGHSIGGLVSTRVAANSKQIDFLVLLASPGLNGDSLMLQQKADFEKLQGLNDAQIAQGQILVKQAYQIITGTSLQGAALKDTLNATYLDAYGSLIPDKARAKLVESLSTSELVSLIRSKPKEDLEKITCRVLAMNGTKDFQVSAKENLSAIQQALEKGGNKHVSIQSLEGLNHLLQEADTGDLSEYAQIEQTIAPRVLETLVSWINAY